jgi:hypothetical protein
MMRTRVLGWATAVALVAAAQAPAKAQFMMNYPVIIVPPPPAQTLVVPRQSPTAQQMGRQMPTANPEQPSPNCRQQGQTRVCN